MLYRDLKKRMYSGRVVLLFSLSMFLISCAALKSDTVFERQNAAPKSYGSYTVQAGDTLYSVAFRHKRDYRDLARINNIQDPYLIRVGQVISLGQAQDEIPSKMGYTGYSVAEPSKTVSTSSRSRTRISPKTTTSQAQATVSTASQASRQPTQAQGRSLRPPLASPRASTLSWQWPADGPVIQNFSSSAVGKRGIQIGGNAGDPVRASAGGQVVYSGDSLVGYGNLVIVKHNDAFLTAYAHNQKVLVKEGDNVMQGQKIAELGSSGTDRNKLHFEIRQEGRPVNPGEFLPRR